MAARIYSDEGEKLIALVMLKASDIHALAQFANEASTYIRCTLETEKEPLVVELHNKVTAPNHYRKLAETAFKNMLSLSDRLGLSPASRHKLKGYKAFTDLDEKETSWYQ
ncbi:MAG: P27 family phage terminase small subunit [Saprospirales bacterium]|nr:P27 family phage terminase small subunit [Saprospirales bacterium]